MIMLTDSDIVIYVLKKLNKVRGKKALQKIIYFIKEYAVPLSYKFRWWYFGPFSKDLYDDIDFLIARDILHYDFEKHIISFKSKRNDIISDIIEQIDQTTAYKINEVINKLYEITKFDPFKLELAASIHFILKYGTGLDNKNKDIIFRIITDIKKDKTIREELFDSIWDSMRNNGFLRDLH